MKGSQKPKKLGEEACAEDAEREAEREARGRRQVEQQHPLALRATTATADESPASRSSPSWPGRARAALPCRRGHPPRTGRVRRARRRRARALRRARRAPRDGRARRRGRARGRRADVGDLFGEVPIALGTRFPFGFRAAEATRIMRVEARDYHAIVSESPDVGVKLGVLRGSGSAGCRASQPTLRHLGRSCSATSGMRPAATCGDSSTATRSRSGGSWPTPRTQPTKWGDSLPPTRSSR